MQTFVMGGVLFFCLDTKEKIPKEKIKAAFFLLLTSSVPLNGLELASLRQSPLFTLHCGRSLDGEKMRPLRVSSFFIPSFIFSCLYYYIYHLSTRMAPRPHLCSVKRNSGKKRRRGDCLSEASSSPFSFLPECSSYINAALIFSLVLSFASRQKKE